MVKMLTLYWGGEESPLEPAEANRKEYAERIWFPPFRRLRFLYQLPCCQDVGYSIVSDEYGDCMKTMDLI